MFFNKLFFKHSKTSSSITKKDTAEAMSNLCTLQNDPSQNAVQKSSENVTETKREIESKTFITCIGGSYSGAEVYFDHSSKKLVGHDYVWHIDDSQEFTGWSDVTLEDVIKDELGKGRFRYKIDKTLEMLYEFFGTEVDNMIIKIKKENEIQ